MTNQNYSEHVLPPGPWLQKLNALLHQEPLASIGSAIVWILILTLATPVASIFLVLQATYNVVLWVLGWNGQDAFNPSKHKERELAVVITGCDSGFGKELALLASKAGFVVFAGCLSKASFHQFKGTTIIPIIMDVTKDSDVKDSVQTVRKWIASATPGRPRVLHALCNNAGMSVPGFIDWNELSVTQRIMDVNFFGMVRCCKAYLLIFKEQRKENTYSGARILNLASVAGKVCGGGILTAYSASKHAAVAFSHGLRLDIASFGIQVTTICPTFHDTPLVTDIFDQIDKHWKTMPDEVVKEYGDDYLKFSKLQFQQAHQMMWRMEVAVDQLMKALTCERVPAEILVGTDAKFFFPLLRMLPYWIYDTAVRYSQPQPVPACLRHS